MARDTIYVHLNRLGGSGWGWLAQLARPSIKSDNSGDFAVSVEPAQCLSMYKTALQSVKILGGNAHATNLCVSADETRAYYSDGDKDWLITDGQPQELHLRKQ